MKNLFFEYTMKQNGYIDEVLKDSLIILDANALLNIYRLSSENREKYFDVLNKVKDRLFLANQSAKEFFANRLNICQNKLKFKENLSISLRNELERIKNKVNNSNFQGDNKDSCNLIKHEIELQESITKIINKSIEEIDRTINSYKVGIDESFISEDKILEKILELFNEKVNKPFNDVELNEIYEDGKKRYEKEVPPGYKDRKKDSVEQFGDLIIWKEILNISNDKEKNILFVSDDRKEDWCDNFKGIDLGPRKELIREFYEFTSKLFYSVTTRDFIKYMSDMYTIEETEKLQLESDIISKDLYRSDSVEKLSELIKDNNYTDLVSTIGNIGRRADNNYLSKILSNEIQPKINTDLVSAIGNIGRIEDNNYLSKILSNEIQPKINTDLVSAIGNIGRIEDNNYLSKILSNEIQPKINTDLVSTIGNIGRIEDNNYLSNKLKIRANNRNDSRNGNK